MGAVRLLVPLTLTAEQHTRTHTHIASFRSKVPCSQEDRCRRSCHIARRGSRGILQDILSHLHMYIRTYIHTTELNSVTLAHPIEMTLHLIRFNQNDVLLTLITYCAVVVSSGTHALPILAAPVARTIVTFTPMR